MLISVIFGQSIEAALQEIEQVKDKVDAAEIRLDFLEEAAWSKLALLKERAGLPLVFTFRKKGQGGHREVAEVERLRLFEKALALKPAFADIEADGEKDWIAKIAKLHPEIQLIGSHHDFEKTPDELRGLLGSLRHPAFTFYKIAVHARSTIDLLRLLVLAREDGKKVPLCCISLGLLGRTSRVLGPLVGNVSNYASPHDSMTFS